MRLPSPHPWFIADLLAAALLSVPALGAKPARVTVDRQGALRIPTATLKQIGVKPDRDGAVWIEFAPPPAPVQKIKPPQAPKLPQPRQPIRILTTVDKGGAIIGRTRIERGRYIPGPPGTLYLATGAADAVILKKP